MLINVVAAFGGNNVFSQTKFIEFKVGPVISSPINSSLPEKDFKDVNDIVKPGITAGFSFDYRLKKYNFVRFCGELYYTGKGEKYKFNDNQDFFNSTLCYLQFCPNVRLYVPGDLIYFGAGLYYGYAVTKDVVSDDFRQSHELAENEYYKQNDYGARASVGTEFGFNNIRFIAELAYEYGLADISNSKDVKVYNQSILLTIGCSIKLIHRGYRHY